MNAATAASATQPLREELWQDTMRHIVKTTPDGGQAPKTVSDDSGQEISLVSTAPAANSGAADEDGVNAILERVRAQQKNRAAKKAATAATAADAAEKDTAGNVPPPGAVTAGLKNVGPNTYERIRQNAERTYLAQAMSFAQGSEETAQTGLFKSA